jgi:hypothetical protein
MLYMTTTGIKLKDRVRATVPVTGTNQRREIVGTVTSSQVADVPGLGPWGTVVVKERGRNLYHVVDHRTVTKIPRTRSA